MEDAAEADAVLEDAVDLDDGVVRLLEVAVGHVIHVKHHLLHFSTHGPASGGGGGCCGGGPYGVWVGTRKAREGIEASAGGGWSLAVAREERRGEERQTGDGGAVVVVEKAGRVGLLLSTLFGLDLVGVNADWALSTSFFSI